MDGVVAIESRRYDAYKDEFTKRWWYFAISPYVERLGTHGLSIGITWGWA